MKIALLGATGRTGKFVLEHALHRGHHVTALVRDAHKLKIAHSNLVVIEGNPRDPERLRETLRDCDAILSALNISRYNDFPWTPLRTPKDFLSTVMSNIISLSREMPFRRLIFTSAWGVAETRKEIPAWFRWLVDHSNLRFAYLDHERQETLVMNSELEWTSVRPVFLSNSSRARKVEVSFNNTPVPRLFISRRGVARFMLDVLEEGRYLRQAPVVFEA